MIRKITRSFFSIALLLGISFSGFGQSISKLIKTGDDHYGNALYEEAIPNYQKAEELILAELEAKESEKLHTKLDFLRHNLGVAYLLTGELEAAEKTLLLSYDYREKHVVNSDVYTKDLVADIANHLGELYLSLYAPKKAKKVIRKAYSYYTKMDLELALEYVDYWRNKTFFDYFSIEFQISIIERDYSSALNDWVMLRKQANFLVSAGAIDWPNAFLYYHQLSLNNLNKEIYKQPGRSTGRTITEEELNNTLTYFANEYGKNSNYYISMFLEYSKFLLLGNDIDEAFNFYSGHIEEIKSAGQVDQAHSADLELLSALVLYKKGFWDQAKSHYDKGIAIKSEYINKNMYFLSLEEQADFWDSYKNDLNLYHQFNLDYIVEFPNKKQGVLKSMVQVQIDTKGKILQSAIQLKNSILATNDTIILNQYAHLVQIKKKYSLMSYGKTTTAGSVNVNDKLEELRINIGDAERKLFAKIDIDESVISVDSIKDALGKNELLVEIIRIPTLRYYKKLLKVTNRVRTNIDTTRRFEIKSYRRAVSDSVNYLAIVIEKGKPLEYITLSNPIQLESIGYKGYRNSIKYKLVDESSFDYYLKDLEPYLESKEVVYLSADGIYHLVNPNNIWHKTKEEFAFESNLFIKLTNPADILKNEVPSYSNEMILFGRPDYGNLNENVPSEKLEIKRAISSLRSESVLDLPGTEEEVNSISDLMGEKYDVKVYLKEMASEDILGDIQSPRFLHIATHGFFRPTENKSEINAMTNSGLLLANIFNQDDFSTLNKDDGILTAMDASLINLTNTQLVVLSACETGLGEVSNGEGVFGLQRGFAIAGTQNSLTSLWKVDDTATKEYMIAFYENLKLHKDNKIAYKYAMLTLKNKYISPYYWGAFVLAQ